MERTIIEYPLNQARIILFLLSHFPIDNPPVCYYTLCDPFMDMNTVISRYIPAGVSEPAFFFCGAFSFLLFLSSGTALIKPPNFGWGVFILKPAQWAEGILCTLLVADRNSSFYYDRDKSASGNEVEAASCSCWTGKGSSARAEPAQPKGFLCQNKSTNPDLQVT